MHQQQNCLLAYHRDAKNGKNVEKKEFEISNRAEAIAKNVE